MTNPLRGLFQLTWIEIKIFMREPLGAIIFYPMIGLCGLFVPIDSLPPTLRAIARVLPLGYSASLMQGIWTGDSWSAHAGDIAALMVVFALGIAVSSRVFRWE